MEKIVRNNIQIVQSFEEVTEPFLKVSVYEKSGIMDHTGPYFINKWKDQLKCTFSGDGWLDFVCPDVNMRARARLRSRICFAITFS